MNNQSFNTIDEFWNQKQVLVTGAGGFIGSHLVEQLLEQVASVRAFVRYNSRGDVGFLRLLPPAVRAKLEIISGDLRDGQAIRDVLPTVNMFFTWSAHLHPILLSPYL
jgi:dTDP-glucose 4,6-dehydratase